MKIINIFKVNLLVIILLSSCKCSNAYTPIVASSINNSVSLFCKDSIGNDLLSDKNFVKNISIIGGLSGRKIPFSISDVSCGTSGGKCMSFNVELPGENNMNFNNDKTNGTGLSVIYVKMPKQTVKLACNFEYNCSKQSYYGNSSIILKEVEYDKTNVTRKDNNTSPLIIDLIVR